MCASDLLSCLLAAFQAVLSLGMHRAGPATAKLFMYLATIEIAALGLWWVYSHDNTIGFLVFRVLTLSVFLWLMQDWQVIAGAAQESFVRLGLMVGGDQLGTGPMHRAGMHLIEKGQELHLAIQGKTADPTWLQHLGGVVNDLTLGPTGWSRLIVAWLVLLAFFLAGVHVFAAQLEFVFCSAMAFITLPFAAWHRTAWIAEKTFGSVIGGGLKLAFLYMLASASIPMLRQYVAPVAPSQQDSLSMLAAGGLIVAMQFKAHKLASGIMHGAPAFTHSDVLPAGRAVAGLASAGIIMAARGMAAAGGRMGAMVGTRRRP